MQMDSSNMQAGTSAPKKNNTTLIIVVVVVVVLLCCCLIAAGAFAYSRYAAGKALSNINSQMATAMPGGSVPSGSVPGGLPSGSVPTGGRGDDVTRAEAWTSAIAAVVPTNPTCVPDATKTTIDVTKQPDSSGAWQERWTVDCGGGTTVPVNITFTPAGAGLFTVKATVAK